MPLPKSVHHRRTPWRWGLVLGVWLIGCLLTRPAAAQTTVPVPVIAAGVPRYWGESPDYDRWFHELAAAGVSAFLPFSEYQEVPEALYLGYEVDFFPPCTVEDAPFQALRANHMQLIVAGEILYADGYPPLDADPLRALLECAGEGTVAAVLSIDEPAWTQADLPDPAQNVRALYERVKAVDPSLPVMMVHAPIPLEITEADGITRPATQADVDAYLERVIALSAYADMVGFDLYPIPAETSGLFAPGLGLQRLDYTGAFPAYLDWLAENFNGQSYFLALQAFSVARQLSPQTAQEVKDAGYDLRFPTPDELRDMACLSVLGGVSEIAWWGQSFLLAEDAAFWEAVLAVTDGLRTDAHRYCGGV